MPFTLSHPAAVLPLLRRPFVPAALVAGAMAPDVAYFIQSLPFRPTTAVWYEPYFNATTTHSLTDLPTVALPLALALVAAYYLLRGPVTALLPARFAPAPPEGPPSGAGERTRFAVWLLVSALIGIVTHVVWDSFTHVDGYVVTRVDFLRDPVPGGLTVARLLQHLSTAVGLVAVGVHLARGGRRTGREGSAVRTRPARAVRWGATAALALAAAAGAFAQTDSFDSYREQEVSDYSRPIVTDGGNSIGYPTRREPVPWPEIAESMLTHAAKGAGTGLGGALLLYAAAWHLRLVPRGEPGREQRAEASGTHQERGEAERDDGRAPTAPVG
ncbi:DUF4184 family protein [Streptomyces qinzhouensis]|uniref:DUF4184 family protein n=1 Tax=Streptomyces qinzhouensis TaxID=2599401 RepID=A0A5B8JFE4_9ACTN|nr:DUF4184 family protein [Streptomyces qinzhouensis]QDY80515.1 DUF4184 family protein [Streptomyces qinzhouensis]